MPVIDPSLLSSDTPPPNLEKWFSTELGLGDEIAQQADVLFFDRFGVVPSGIVLLPKTLESKLPKANRRIVRMPAMPTPQIPTSPTEKAYTPPKRKPRTDVTSGERSYGIESISCQEVTLRLTSTRASCWGVSLDLLPYSMNQEEALGGAFQNWLHAYQLVQNASLPPDAISLLYAAFSIAWIAKRRTTEKLFIPRLPLIHNQRCGKRYRLHFDKAKMGSPCDIHVLLYEPGRKPLLYGVPAVDRPTADERKEGLSIFATWDKRIRFYQATQSQWAEWEQGLPEFADLDKEIAHFFQLGCTAARRLRQCLG